MQSTAAMGSTPNGTAQHGDFVFAALRALMSSLHADDPRSKRFRVVTWLFFGSLLAFFLLFDRVSPSSYRWAELYFLLGYLSAAVLGCVFQLYRLVDSPTLIGERLRDVLRPVDRLWLHLALAITAAAIQILNFRTARVDVTFGSRHLVHFLGVTTSATGCYEMFGAALFTYCGFVLFIKLGRIFRRFGPLFGRPFTRNRDRVEAMETLLWLNHVVFSAIACFALYLLCWRTGGFSQVVPVNGSFFVDVIALLLVAVPAVAFTIESRGYVIAAHERALRKSMRRSNDGELPWLVKSAARLVFGVGYAGAYAMLALVFSLVIVAYAVPTLVESVVSYSSPLVNAFLGSPLALLAAWLITSRVDRIIDRTGEAYRRLLEE